MMVALPPLFAVAVWGPPWAWTALVAGAIAIAGAECFVLLARNRRIAWVGAIGSLGAGALLYLGSASTPMAPQILVVLASAALAWWWQSRLPDVRRPTPFSTVAAILFTAVYCGLLPAHLALLRRDAGSAWALFTLAVAWGGDIGGYLAGKAVGGPKLAARVSPNKTIAGSVAGLAAAAVIGILFAQCDRKGMPAIRIVFIAIVAGVLSQAGDLLESHLKRRSGAKDSGVVIAGHGGMLDSIDGLILAAPWIYYAHRYLG